MPGQETWGDSAHGLGGALWGGLTAWSTDLDGLAAGHGLGAGLAHTFFTAEGHLVTNGEWLPGRGSRQKVSTCLRGSEATGDLTTHTHSSLVTHSAFLLEHQANLNAVPSSRLTKQLSVGPGGQKWRLHWATYLVRHWAEHTAHLRPTVSAIRGRGY